MNKPIKICLFASGSGSNVENIHTYFTDKENIIVDSVVCNRKNAFVFERAKKLDLDAFYCSKEEFEKSNLLISLLKEREIDYIILAGFLLKIPQKLIKSYNNKIINIHPALLPKYGGKGMYGMHVHNAVYAAKEEKTGITIHLVNEKYDDGKIISQAETSLNPADSPEDIAQKIHQLEFENFPKVIEDYILSNKV